MKRFGFAQIPLMIGLLLMALAVPVATKLVQNNQDTRNKASAPISGCKADGTMGTCTSLICCNGMTSMGGNTCKCGTSSASATPTLAGACTQLYNRNLGCACGGGIDCASGTCTSGKCAPRPTPTLPGDCNQWYNRHLGCVCTSSSQCDDTGICTNGTCQRKPAATLTPTPTLRPTPTLPGDCNQWYNRHLGCVCTSSSQCDDTGICTNGTCQRKPAATLTPTPTLRPTPTLPGDCNQWYNRHLGCVCTSSSQCDDTGICTNGTCQRKPAATLTPTPTLRPTPTLPGDCNQWYNRHLGCVCTSSSQCDDTGICTNGTCQRKPAATLTPTPTLRPTPTLPGDCNQWYNRHLGCVCTSSSQCDDTGICTNGTCQRKPAATLTPTPTLRPTPTLPGDCNQWYNRHLGCVCTSSSQCDDTGICTNGTCQRKPAATLTPTPTLRPTPTLPGDCNQWYNRHLGCVCTSSSQCDDTGICTNGTCQPKPTATPTPPCIRDGVTCGSVFNCGSRCCSKPNYYNGITGGVEYRCGTKPQIVGTNCQIGSEASCYFKKVGDSCNSGNGRCTLTNFATFNNNQCSCTSDVVLPTNTPTPTCTTDGHRKLPNVNCCSGVTHHAAGGPEIICGPGEEIGCWDCATGCCDTPTTYGGEGCRSCYTCTNTTGQSCQPSATFCSRSGVGTCATGSHCCVTNTVTPPTTYTCTNTTGQSCQPSATFCSRSGVGTCATGSHCCVTNTVTPPVNCTSASSVSACAGLGAGCSWYWCAAPAGKCFATGTSNTVACPTPGGNCSSITSSSACTGANCAWYICANKCFPRGTSNDVACPPVIINTPTPTPKDDDDDCVEACPNASEKNLLQNCTPPDTDGTSKDSLCNRVGRKESCGGSDYCCPSVNGNWTRDMTMCPVGNCTQCPNDATAKGKGDADCSSATNINDASIWRSEFIEGELGIVSKSIWRADFDCDGKVTLNDISIWRTNFINSL